MKRMNVYFTDEAQILVAESRTSSLVRISGDKERIIHTEIEGVFPYCEAANYALGIVLATIDGYRLLRCNIYRSNN